MRNWEIRFVRRVTLSIARCSGHYQVVQRRKSAIWAFAAAIVVASSAWLLTAVRSGSSSAPPEPGRPFTFNTVVPPGPEAPVAARTVIAEVSGAVPLFDGPSGSQTGTLPIGGWWTEVKYLPVVEQRMGWLHVRLPERPNGSTGWIRASDASLSDTSYGIVIDTAARRVQLFEAGQKVVDVPAGVGTPDDPTPVGVFYVMDVAEPPGPGWGPFVIDTNAHSESIDSWQGSGDAFTAIHGPLGADALIGTEGAAISHGCVRLHEEDLERFSPVVPGTPVVII